MPGRLDGNLCLRLVPLWFGAPAGGQPLLAVGSTLVWSPRRGATSACGSFHSGKESPEGTGPNRGSSGGMAGGPGFEPRLSDPKSDGLPLADPPAGHRHRTARTRRGQPLLAVGSTLVWSPRRGQHLFADTPAPSPRSPPPRPAGAWRPARSTAQGDFL